MSDEYARDLRDTIARADRIKKFLEDPGWREDIEPFMAKDQKFAQDGLAWRPSSDERTVDKSAMTRAYLSGANDAMARVEKFIRDCLDRGAEAAENLKKLETNK